GDCRLYSWFLCCCARMRGRRQHPDHSRGDGAQDRHGREALPVRVSSNVMRVVVIGLGIQGSKRLAIAGTEAVTTVDPVNAAAAHSSIRDIPLDSYDAALVCTPDAAKLELLEYLLGNGKHVLVEKPLLAADGAALDRLAVLAQGA